MYSPGDMVYVKNLDNTHFHYSLDPDGYMLISFLKKERVKIFRIDNDKCIKCTVGIENTTFNYDINDLTTVKEEINLNIPYNFYPEGWYEFLKFVKV